MDSGNFAWAIAATALVLFMTPGVAFFYGGLVKAKSVVSMMMRSFGALGLGSGLGILYGFNMSAMGVGRPLLAGHPFSDCGLQSLSASRGGIWALVGAAVGPSFGAIGLVSVLWILYGFNMSAIGDGSPFLAGNPFSDFGLQSLSTSEGGSAALVGATFGATFAIITVALISGAIADSAKFGSWL